MIIDTQYNNLLLLIRMTIEGKCYHLCQPDWGKLLEIARQQAISGFISKSAISCNPSNISDWQKEYYVHFSNCIKNIVAQDNLHHLLISSNIEYSVMKGWALQKYYPDYTMRTMGDIDIIVSEESFYHSYCLLNENGFKSNAESFNKALEIYPGHIGFCLQGISYELHRFFVKKNGLPKENCILSDGNSLSDEFNQLIINNIKNAVQDSICIGDKVYQFNRLPDIINGLIIIQHINQHIRTGVGLRQIIDWSMFVRSNNKSDWWEDFEWLLRHFNLKKFADYLTGFSQRYLGIEGNIAHNIDEIVCYDLLMKIFRDGNFGHNDSGTSSNLRKAFASNNGSLNFFKRLHKGGISHWDAAKRYSILRPFAWIYQLARIVTMMLFRKSPLISIKNDIKDANQEIMLLEKLGLI